MSTPFPSPDDGDWATPSFLNAYLSAVNERLAVGSGIWSPLPLVEVGQDVQTAWWMWSPVFSCQFIVEGLANGVAYIDHEAEGGVYTGLDYNLVGEGGVPRITPQRLAEIAGLHFPGLWRAYTVHPDDGGEPEWRVITEGDIIGPWLWQDLAAGISALQWTGGYAVQEVLASRYGASEWSTEKTWEEHEQEAEGNTADEAEPVAQCYRAHSLTGGPYPPYWAQASQRAARWRYGAGELPEHPDLSGWDLYFEMDAIGYWHDAGIGLSQGWNRAGGLAPGAWHTLGNTSGYPPWRNEQGDEITWGCQPAGAWTVKKWTFTHSN